MIRAILFDFNGVMADDEAAHFQEYTTIVKPSLFPSIVEFVKRAEARDP
ncbi:MAG: hypothetical protein ACREIJ_02995 [Nitrospiraceae bacterium]